MDIKEMLLNFVPSCEQEERDREFLLKYLDTYEDVLTRENVVGHFTSSGFIVNKDRTKCLMIHHNIYNAWAWTGGHADGDSDFLHVAVKEAEEETGIPKEKIKVLTETPATLEILTVDGHVKRGKYVSSHLHLNVAYLLEVDEAEEIRIKPDENSGIKWIELDKLEESGVETKMIHTYRKLIAKAKNI